MPCDKCNGYWICDPSSNDPCAGGGGFETVGPDWKEVGTQDIETAGTYHIWSRPGFRATIAKDQPAGPPEWNDAGEMQLEQGTYKLWSRPQPGGGGLFQVKVEMQA